MKSRFSVGQIINILKEADTGITFAEGCRKHNSSDAAYYQWNAKFGGKSLPFRLKKA